MEGHNFENVQICAGHVELFSTMYKIVSLIYQIVSNMKALVDLLNIILTRTLLIALNRACVEIR